eukprot:scaffold13094_cov162-Amphora_coffeaeformis.AAC.1
MIGRVIPMKIVLDTKGTIPYNYNTIPYYRVGEMQSYRSRQPARTFALSSAHHHEVGVILSQSNVVVTSSCVMVPVVL